MTELQKRLIFIIKCIRWIKMPGFVDTKEDFERRGVFR